jgi:hypothetical protein
MRTINLVTSALVLFLSTQDFLSAATLSVTKKAKTVDTVTVTAAATAISPASLATETLFTTQVPTTLNNTDGSSANYELGMKFTATVAGKINAIRFYKSASESGTHTGKIYSSTGTLLASVAFASETASGWQSQALATPLAIAANTTYVVSVNTGKTYYVDTVSGLATQVTNGHLKSVVGSNGVYGAVGAMPTSSYQNSNYFRDVIFAPTTTTDTTAPTVSITAPTSGSVNAGSVKVTATASDSVGVAGVQFLIDGANLSSEVTASPYTVTLDTTAYANGTHTLGATARDAAGNKTTAQVSVTFTNMKAPTSLRSTSTTAKLVALQWDYSGATPTGFYVNRKTGSTGTYARLATVASSVLTYSDATVAASTNYYYQVQAYNSTSTLSSNELSVTTLAAATKPTITSFTASPTSITAGNSSTLSWVQTGATSMTINGTTVTGTSLVVKPSATTTYTLSAVNATGTTTATATVTVTAVAKPVITSFTASPASINAGSSSTLSWAQTGATSMSINGTTVTGTSLAVTPSATTTYTLSATNSTGTTTATATVTVTASSSTACTKTFTPSTVGSSPYPGSSVNTAVQGGSAGTVLCFAAGTYGEIDIYNAHPSGVVTIKPVDGAAVNMGVLNLNGVSNLTITGFSGTSTSSGLIIQVAGQGNNSNITFSKNAMTENGVYIANNTNTNANINITDNTFIGFTNSEESSRINVVNNSGCPNGITISNNLISGGQADGIDISGNSCGTQIINNEIKDIIESNCGGIHCDAIQDNGGGNGTVISGNYIHNVSDCFLMDDGSSNYVIKNNVCATNSNSSYWMQFGGAQKITLDHNTIISSAGAQFGNDHNSNPSSNVTFTNNILYSEPVLNPGQPVSGTLTQDYNLCPSGCTGSHSVKGTPTFVGGTTPTTYAGFVLASASAGRNVGSDGKDIGINTTGSSSGSSVVTCTQTLSVGADLVNAVTNAAAGSTICLASGNWGAVTFNGIVKTNYVTIQSATAQGASISPTVNNGSQYLSFSSMTIPSMQIIGASTKHIKVLKNLFNSSILDINTVNFNNNDILVDGNSFTGVSATGAAAEGRVSVHWPNGPGTVAAGVTISNNTFDGGGCSDGVQIGSYGVVVGPGNVFTNLTQGSCVEHVDAIQGYGHSHAVIKGNYFNKPRVCLGFYDDGNTDVFQDNVFIGSGVDGSQCVIDIGSGVNQTFTHNTVYNVSARVGGINNSAGGSGTYNNNIFYNSSFNSGPLSACTSCTFTHNLFNVTGNARGTDNLSGTPTFTGGAPSSTWAGWKLLSTSVGYLKATDSTDMGTTFYGN